MGTLEHALSKGVRQAQGKVPLPAHLAHEPTKSAGNGKAHICQQNQPHTGTRTSADWCSVVGSQDWWLMPPPGAFGRRATLRSIRRARLLATYPTPVRAPETLRGDLQPRFGWLVSSWGILAGLGVVQFGTGEKALPNPPKGRGTNQNTGVQNSETRIMAPPNNEIRRCRHGRMARC